MTSLRFLFAAVISMPLLRADVLVVDAAGGGDFTSLGAAVAAAASGDTLLVVDGTYAEAGPVIIDDKALHVVGEWAGQFAPGVEITKGLVVRNLPPAKRVVLQNLVLHGAHGTATTASTPALTLSNNSSHVRVQSCLLFGGSGGHNDNPDGAPGVAIVNSLSTALVGSFANGGSGQFSPTLAVVTGDGGPGIALAGGQVLVSHGSASGGDGGSNNIGGWPDGGTGGAGIVHSSGSILFASGSAHGGTGGTSHFGGDGGPGLSLGGSGFAWLLGGSGAGGGSGGGSDEGPFGANGPSITDPSGLLTDFGGTEHAFDVTSPLREGQVGTLDFGGGLGDTTLLFASLSLHQLPLPGYQGVLLLAPNALVGPFTFPPPGNQDVPFLAPDLPAGVEVLVVHLQPAYSGSDGVNLGTGRVLTLLDAAF